MVGRLMRRSCARCDKNRSIQAHSPVFTNFPRISAHERVGDEFSDTGEEFRAHPRMETLSIAGSDRQYAQAALDPQRGERNGADFNGVLAEQIVTLRVADLSASRLAGLQQGLKGLDVGISGVAGAQESACGGLQSPCLIEE